MKVLGKHLIAELTGCDKVVLNDPKKLRKIFKTAATKAGATVLKVHAHRYNPQGVSVMVIIAESHLSAHTWPEYGYAAVDLFTCGEHVDPHKGLDYIKQELRVTKAYVKKNARGIPSSVMEKLAHK